MKTKSERLETLSSKIEQLAKKQKLLFNKLNKETQQSKKLEIYDQLKKHHFELLEIEMQLFRLKTPKEKLN